MENPSIQPYPRLLRKRRARTSRLIGLALAALGLVILTGRYEIPVGIAQWIFTLTILLAMALEAYFIYAPYFQDPSIQQADGEVELSAKTKPSKNISPLYDQRSVVRFLLLGLVAFSCGLFAVQLLRMIPALEPAQAAPTGVVAMMYYFFGVTFVARLQYVAIRRFSKYGGDWRIWLAVSVVVGSALGFGLTQDSRVSNLLPNLAWALPGIGIVWVIYVDNRLGINDKVWSEVLQDLSLNLMQIGTLRSNRQYVVDIIGRRLGYERVFLLEPTPDRQGLNVTAEFGDYPSVMGNSLPASAGITAHAFSTGIASAWNDVSQCPYYHQLIPKEKDTTRAEIAVPIQHRGEIFGVLDVQSRRRMGYAPLDVRSLETIANILGMSMAINNADLLLAEANSLWNQLSEEGIAEAETFNLIANFGRDKLGADVVIYYPLSPTGHPLKPPEVVGELYVQDRMKNGVSNLSSPLVKLIEGWEPVFESNLDSNSIFFHRGQLSQPPFAEREKIKSASFIPIGTKNEKLGIVFLNYRRTRDFDSIYRLTVMAFAQALATLASKARYRQIVFEGFGRPDLGVHNIQAKYGLKKGILREGKSIFATRCRTLFMNKDGIDDCGMFGILRNVDGFLTEIRAQTTVEYDIWNRTLREAFQDYTRRMKEQSINRHIWFITELDPHIERESPWTRLALYRILTEAVNNAVFHARAMEIDVLVKRMEKQIYLCVKNNGELFPEEAQHNRSRGGIFTLLDELVDQFGATYSIVDGGVKGGAILEANFPALPLPAEVNRV